MDNQWKMALYKCIFIYLFIYLFVYLYVNMFRLTCVKLRIRLENFKGVFARV